MRPILLQGHTRSLTQIKYNREGDLLFSVSKDKVINVWYSHNGERLGTYNGHQGSVWTVDVNSTSTMIITGAADNTAKLWEVQTGRCLKTWEFKTAVKRVEFSEDDTMALCVTEERMGYSGSVTVLAVNPDVKAQQSDEPIAVIVNDGKKAVVAGWGPINKYIISGHEDGTICQWDWKAKEKINTIKPHESELTDMQFSPDRTYFITSSKDKSAQIFESDTLKPMKKYTADTPLNSAAITPKFQEFVILGGGQDAMSVTTTSARAGKFESRFYHKILEEEVGRVRGHFGPINTIAVHPDGKSYSSGGEDGYVRVHHYDPDFFKFKIEA
ncbi:WD40-repeat-containing domain protein [Radiomyces spectabilis]|uniref:WD40-repeat-containing domain protein n=1 Tax=Radiomyces spectabilis TaxID=64574 RepID=UPI002220855E|nr:WD40-repeat-containing domain protein [Radiomyces spectabilis]KAI8388136.1 WD40-repeat-containing domain protein [Radiomyces spectabilis]